MLKDAIKPSQDDLQSLVDEALDNGNKLPVEFIEAYLNGVVAVLKQNPKSYQAYGMWWWSLKQLLNDYGYKDFGTTSEAITPTLFNYDDPVLTCCAAWAYHHDNVNQGNIYNGEHFVPLKNGDTYAYYLTDNDMLELIM